MRPPNLSDAQMLSWLETQYDLNDNGCWVWRNYIQPDGYGKVLWNGKTHLPHRLYWLLSGRKIPEGLDMCHGPGCVRACFNPAHLQPGTRSKNVLDRHRDGTFTNSKLTEEQVRAILTDVRGVCVIAEEYRVSHSTICDIKTGRTWSWVA